MNFDTLAPLCIVKEGKYRSKIFTRILSHILTQNKRVSNKLEKLKCHPTVYLFSLAY